MVPFRPRQYGNISTTPGQEQGGWLETEEEYEAAEEEALGDGGYGAMAQMQTSAGQAAMLEGLDGKASSVGGGYGKKRVGEQSRGQMNLTAGQGRSILTGG